MNGLITVPTVEQINIEHQLANSKASEAVQHATNCGLMLLQIKASLNHGEWLPWLNGEIEAGRLKVKTSQAHKYLRLASNLHCSVNLIEAPSINAALELLSDKEPEEQQGTLIDVEAERQAREAAEAKAEAEHQARELFERRAKESQAESNARSKKIRELEQQITLLESQPKSEPERIEVTPDDYETAKAKAAQLESELEALKKKQAQLINAQVKAKLHEYQSEVDAIEQRKAIMQDQVDRMKAYLASMDKETRRLEVHQQVIEELRLKLLSLAVFLSDEDPVQDADTIKRWRALADMLEEAMTAVRQYFWASRPQLSVICGDSA